MNEAAGRRARSGGGATRRAERTAVSFESARFIQRNIPNFEILNEEALQIIEWNAETVLEEIGVNFVDNPGALALWRAAGADVKGERVYIPRGLARSLCATAPSHFTQAARNPERNVEIGGRNLVLAPVYGPPFVRDAEGGRRYATLHDFHNFVKLGYMSKWLHHSGGTVCEPTDVPVNKRHLDMVMAHIELSDRPFMGSVTAEDRSEDSIAMARILFGEAFVNDNCVILGNVNVISPLVWDGTMTRSLRAYARAGQAAVVVPFILGGAMGPVTSAGGIVQSLAETMAGCALTQLERKGAPVIFGNFLSTMSLRSGSPTFGTPEPAIGSQVIGQLARRLKLPLRCSGNFTTSKLPDGQAMMEGTMSMLAAIHCGANFILHSAGFLDGLLSMSYEKFMMDADLCGSLHAYLDGIRMEDDQLAVEAFAEVGPGNHFFGASHTLRHYQTAFWDSDLSDNEPFEKWEAAGSEDIAIRANRQWKKRLAEYEAPALDAGIRDGLQDFVAAKKAEAPDAWH